MMKRISPEQYADLEKQYHYLYRRLPLGATIMDLSSASQVKALLKKENIVTDKSMDRVHVTAWRTSIAYAKKLIQGKHPVLAINTNEKGVTEESMAAFFMEFSIKLTKFSETLFNKLYNDPSDEEYYARNIMPIPSITRHLQLSFTQDYAPSPSQAKKDLLQLAEMDEQTRAAEDTAIKIIRIDSADAKLLDIRDVSTVTNKDTRAELNTLSNDMMESIGKIQDNTAASAPAEDNPAEESEDFFFSLFDTSTSSSSKPSSGGRIDNKEDNSDTPRRRSSRKSASR